MSGTPQPEPTADLVAGGWAACTEELGFALEDPATGAQLRPALGTGADRIAQALAVADELHAAGVWSSVPAARRAEILDAVADAVAARTAEIVALESAATGVPIRQTTPVGMIMAGSFRLAAAQLREGWLSSTAQREDGRTVEVERLPWGPAACVVPWNSPAPMAAHKVANALAAGCPTILKPSEFAPYGTQLLARVIDEALTAAGVPAGVFQLVQGDAGGRRPGRRRPAHPRRLLHRRPRRRPGGRRGLRLRHQAGPARARRQQPAGHHAGRGRSPTRPAPRRTCSPPSTASGAGRSAG